MHASTRLQCVGREASHRGTPDRVDASVPMPVMTDRRKPRAGTVIRRWPAELQFMYQSCTDSIRGRAQGAAARSFAHSAASGSLFE